MQLTKDVLFGAHTIAILDPSNGYLPYTDSIFEIIGNINVNSTFENVDLMGGSNQYPFASESGVANAEVQMTIRQLNQGLMQSAVAAAVASTIASTTGTVDNFVNTKNSTVKQASTGIASVSVLSGSEANLKTGLFH